MLIQRILTAAVLIPLVIVAIFFLPPEQFAVASAIVLLFAAWEWCSLMKIENGWYKIAYVITLACVMSMVYSLFDVTWVLALSAFWWLFALMLVLRYPRNTDWWVNNKWLLAVMGVCSIVPCWVAMNYLHYADVGSVFLLYALVLVWAMDIGGYFAGRSLGKYPLASDVSPAKTVEGVVGGLLLVFLVSVVAIRWLPDGLSVSNLPSLPVWIILALCIGLVAVLGDLFESMLKRNAGLKNSGHLLPGHGGILDRFDSMLAALPMFALGLKIVGGH